MYYIYSLKCVDGYYVGCTSDLRARIKKHQQGGVPATVKRLPVELSFYVAVRDRIKAYKLEKYFKSGSGRVFINRHF